MVRPVPSMITQLANGAQLWASGTFRGMDMWVLENNIDLIVNLLGNQVSRRVIWIEWDMNKLHRDDWGEKMHEVLETMTSFLYSGQNVLVHCQHGLHRTGSLIVLWLALGLVGEEGVADNQGWLNKLTEAWETWKRGRQLRQAALDDRRGRDYESESWAAVTEFFSDMPIKLVRELAETWKTAAEARAMQSPQSVQSRLPLQTPPANVVLLPKETAEVEAKKRPSPKAAPPKSWPKSASAIAGAKPKCASVLSAPSLQSPPGKRPRGSAGLAADATSTSGSAVFLKPTVKAEAKQKQTKQVQPRPKLEAKPKQTQSQQKKEKQPKQPEQKKRKHKESQPSSSSVPSAQSQPSAESQPSEPLSKKQRAQRDYGSDWIPGEEWQDGDWSCRRCGNHNWRNRGFCNRNTCKRPRDADFCVGYDWYCRCGNFNKGHRQVCNRGNCKQPRAGNEQSP